jgi:glycosyltransferase involved in cell wall biosynthesis
MRAFFRDERMDEGSLAAGSIEERMLRRIERRLGRTAHGLVTLAAAAVPVVAKRYGAALAERSVVIPTCVDLGRFVASPLPAGRARLGLVGTLNRVYDVPAMIKLSQSVERLRAADLVVVAAQRTPWDRDLAESAVTLRPRSPAEMPALIASMHAGLSMRRPECALSSKAAMPTKIGEFLASGRPVVASAGLGDMDTIIAEFGCGVVVRSNSFDDIDAAAGELSALMDDPGVSDRCRAAAESRFNIEDGVDRLVRLYGRTVKGS